MSATHPRAGASAVTTDWRGRLAAATEKAPWIWAGLGATGLWVGLGVVAGRGMLDTMEATLQVGSFLVLVGIGQLLVISTGNGNIDLSIPSVMTLSSLVALSTADGADDRIIIGLLAGLGAGLAVGIVNVFIIFVLRIPPIVATLASGLFAQSAILRRATSSTVAAPPRLREFASGDFVGLPKMALLTLGFSVLAAVVLHRGVFGRHVFALGQNKAATSRAGLPTTRTAAICFLLSSQFAALSGILLASYTGPTISLGTPYLLTSIAVVVLGGSLISGGRSTVAGLWTAMVMLNLIVTLVFVMQWNVAIRDIFQGLVIMGVLTAAGGKQRVA
ncbi:MAG: ABC transporter permease [Acidimicrobiales bacterium]|nr:MAG: ABC transporter permease [Acidimicrobiales bacterium]